MALADDFFMFAADTPEDPGSATLAHTGLFESAAEEAPPAEESGLLLASVPSSKPLFAPAEAEETAEPEEAPAFRKSRPTRVVKPANKANLANLGKAAARPSDKGTEAEGQLARMVRELSELEDDILTKLGAVERQFTQLESRRAHEDGGYVSTEEFEQRMLASTPILRAMRDALSPKAARAKLSVARRDPGDARTRRSKALTAIARGLERIRALDVEIRASASAARAQLQVIEGMRIYDECGYVSFEEFLERALGPSPVLASAVALIADDPAPPLAPEEPARVESAPPPSTPATPSASSEDYSDPFGPVDEPGGEGKEGRAGADDPQPASPEPAPTASAAPESLPAKVGRSRTAYIFSALLCVIATIGGAATGVWTQHSAKLQAPADASTASEAKAAGAANAEPVNKDRPAPAATTAGGAASPSATHRPPTAMAQHPHENSVAAEARRGSH